MITIEEYARLDEPEEYRTELVRGRIVQEPRPSAPHGRTQALLAERLVAFVRERELGMVFVDVGVVLDRRQATVRGPDLLFISHRRLPSPLPEGFLEVAPDLAVEIVSPSNTRTEIEEKVREYLDAGTRLVWVVDPGGRTATIHPAEGEHEIVEEHATLHGGAVLPGLRITLSDVLPER